MILFPSIYLVFFSTSLLLIAGTAALPFAHVDFRFHMLLGLAAAFVNCLLHTSVMIHLVGTGRSFKEAVPHVPKPRRSYIADQTAIKTRSYPISTLACALACATAILGGARAFGAVSTAAHTAIALALLAANLAALPVQYRLLIRNGALQSELEAELEAVVRDLEAKGKLPEVMPWQA